MAAEHMPEPPTNVSMLKLLGLPGGSVNANQSWSPVGVMAAMIEPLRGEPESVIALAFGHASLGSPSWDWQVALHPSPFAVLPSSHCSPGSIDPLPQSVHAPAEQTPPEPPSVHVVPSGLAGSEHVPICGSHVPTS